MRFANLGPTLAVTLLFTACADTSDPDRVNDDADAGMPAEVPAEPIELQTLDASDFAVSDLEGRLGCSFSEMRGGEPLLVGYAFVAEDKGADAAIKVNGKSVPLSMTGAGGYERMADGATFMGGNLMAEVEVIGTEPLGSDPEVAGDSPAFASVLTVTRMEHDVAYAGFWNCGP